MSKYKKYWSLGDRVTVDGVTLQVVISDNCGDCYFRDRKNRAGAVSCEQIWPEELAPCNRNTDHRYGARFRKISFKRISGDD
ncbi:MAG: hypothetical protein LBH06_00805 [Rikenellaceae bacterium]|jgi:hypothetical protein|nr:hypothetical protein [Rikenellaceae bacterium]